SEIEYQISGITCKTDKKSLTVGMKTGRSLELDNVFMTQSALNDLYYKLKNLTYYPYNLNYQGHLLLEVGQWVTIQTNKKETFKVPVLSQSFTFKGGLRGRISADSKAGNDTQYSYEGTITKQIKQQDGVEAKIQAQIEAADKDFDQKVDKIKKDFNDQVELAKARAEEVKRELSDTINQRFNSFDNGPLKEAKRKAEEALRNAGASSSLAQDSKRIGLDSVARLEAFKSQTTSAQTALSGDLDALKRTIANDIRPKQAQAEAEIAKQVEALSRTKNELAGASTLLAQEAKRIELDSVARLEAFKSQTTSAQTALSGDLDVLKQTIANDIRPKQAQAEADIAKQVEALSRTKNELAGVKSAQATYKETTTRRLSELTNLANGKASKSELTQTAEELASKIASVHLGRRNLLKGTKELARYKPVSEYNGFKVIRTVAGATRYQDSYVERTVIPTAGTEYIAIFYARASENDYPVRCHFYNPNTVVSSENSSGYKSRSSDGLSIIRLSTDWQLCWVKWTQTATDQAKTVIIGRHGPQVGGKEGVWVEICAPAIFEGNLAGDWSPAYEDQDERVSAVESNFKQRADSLEAGVSRLTEGLRTKADISSLNVTAENIRQSVKSLETDTQNKLNQKLSQAEFEVRAGSIRQEILNATKDKASKSELTQTAEELASRIASVKVGGRNYYRDS
ncbi:peptidase S74, partial [Streptococcus pneumoniae]|nr:peptidase S74 [Streptococcus pneumoniae]